MHEELKSWGYPGGGDNALILKRDGEKSMIGIRDALGVYHGGRITPEKPPTGESQSNGKIEEAGKTIRGIAKSFEDQIEFKTKKELDAADIIMQWLVRWAGMLYSRFRKGKDGRTPYQMQKGRVCKTPVVPFGEKVMYKKLKDGGKKNALDSEWEDGIWLGHARSSNETLIGTSRGVIRAWAWQKEKDGTLRPSKTRKERRAGRTLACRERIFPLECTW